MKKILILTLIVLGIAVFGITNSKAETIDFYGLDQPHDPLDPDYPDFNFMQTYLSTGGFLLESDQTGYFAYQAFAAPLTDTGLHYGSANLMIWFQDESAILTKPGSPFTLNSIDLHGIGDVSTVEFFAYKGGESPVSQQFALSDVEEWHTFNFDSRFQNIDSVKWQQGDSGFHSFDNIVLNNVVPEPISCVLFGIGGLTLAGFRRFRKK
jgi:hypothetical protein